MIMSSMASFMSTATTMAAMSSSTVSGITMSTSNAGAMSMAANTMMIFNTANTATMIFTSSFMPTTEGQYVGAWFFVFFLAVIWRALVFLQLQLDQHWINKHMSQIRLIKGGEEPLRPIEAFQPWRLSTNLPRATLAFVIQAVAYIL